MTLFPLFHFFVFRLSRLLLRLPALRLMNATITEELFFKGLIGNVRIDSVIPHILKMEPADYNSQIIGHSIWKLRAQCKLTVLSQNTRRHQIELLLPGHLEILPFSNNQKPRYFYFNFLKKNFDWAGSRN